MRRLFYLSLGATVGVLVVRKVSRAAEQLTPAGLSANASGAVGGLAAAVRAFTVEVRAGMAEREGELRTALGLDGGHDQVDAHTLRVAASPFSVDPDEEPPSGVFR